MKVEEAVKVYGNIHRLHTREALEALIKEGLVIRDGDQLRKP